MQYFEQMSFTNVEAASILYNRSLTVVILCSRMQCYCHHQWNLVLITYETILKSHGYFLFSFCYKNEKCHLQTKTLNQTHIENQ